MPTNWITSRRLIGDIVYHELSDMNGNILIDASGSSLSALSTFTGDKWIGRTLI